MENTKNKLTLSGSAIKSKSVSSAHDEEEPMVLGKVITAWSKSCIFIDIRLNEARKPHSLLCDGETFQTSSISNRHKPRSRDGIVLAGGEDWACMEGSSVKKFNLGGKIRLARNKLDAPLHYFLKRGEGNTGGQHYMSRIHESRFYFAFRVM